MFDGAEEEDDAEGSRLPLLIVLALVGAVRFFAGVVWLACTQGVARGRSETFGAGRVGRWPGKGRAAEILAAPAVPYQGFKIYEQPAPPDDQADASPPAQAAKPESAPAQQAAAPPFAKPEPTPKVPPLSLRRRAPKPAPTKPPAPAPPGAVVAAAKLPASPPGPGP